MGRLSPQFPRCTYDGGAAYVWRMVGSYAAKFERRRSSGNCDGAGMAFGMRGVRAIAVVAIVLLAAWLVGVGVGATRAKRELLLATFSRPKRAGGEIAPGSPARAGI